jgi:autotransporter-associated beta strand protein
LIINQGGSSIISGIIAGSGSLALNAINGTGTLTLTGNNTYAGTTTISSGATLQIGNGGTTGSLGTGSVTNNGTLSFNRNNAITIANVISGEGGLIQVGSGTAIITRDNTYSGATIINSGTTLQVGSGSASTTGSLGTSAITNNGTLVFNRSSVTASNAISWRIRVRVRLAILLWVLP